MKKPFKITLVDHEWDNLAIKKNHIHKKNYNIYTDSFSNSTN